MLGLCCYVGFSLVARGHSLVVVHGLLIMVASLVAEHELWGERAFIAVAHRISCSQYVGSSLTRDRTCVSCIGRQILYR